MVSRLEITYIRETGPTLHADSSMGLVKSQVTALLMVATCATFASAQDPKGATFSGKVYADTSMRVIPGVEITLPALSKRMTP